MSRDGIYINMEYNFKEFTKLNARLESRITITKSNSFGFPTKFSDDNKIKNFKYVVLFYDKDSKAIGIHFTNDEEKKNKFSIIKYEKYGASVVARSFFKMNSINTGEHHGRYHWKIVKVENIGKLFVIELGNKDLKSE
jgi:hypothetical protein